MFGQFSNSSSGSINFVSTTNDDEIGAQTKRLNNSMSSNSFEVIARCQLISVIECSMHTNTINACIVWISVVRMNVKFYDGKCKMICNGEYL